LFVQAKPGETSGEAGTAANDRPSTVRKQHLMKRRQLVGLTVVINKG